MWIPRSSISGMPQRTAERVRDGRPSVRTEAVAGRSVAAAAVDHGVQQLQRRPARVGRIGRPGPDSGAAGAARRRRGRPVPLPRTSSISNSCRHRPQGRDGRHDDRGRVGGRLGMGDALLQPGGLRHAGDGGRGGGALSPSRLEQRHLRLGHGHLRGSVGTALQRAPDSPAGRRRDSHLPVRHRERRLPEGTPHCRLLQHAAQLPAAARSFRVPVLE